MLEFLTASKGWVLPSSTVIHLWWMLGWALVAAAVVRRLTGRAALGALVFVLLCLPGRYAPLGYWALVVQSPSVVLVGWAFAMLGMPWERAQHLGESGAVVETGSGAEFSSARVPTLILMLLSALGWGLALEVFQVWPHGWASLFALGFEPLALWSVLLVTVLTVWRYSNGTWRWPIFLMLGVFVVLRVPTGNLWDALLDPFVWVGCQVVVIRRFMRR